MIVGVLAEAAGSEKRVAVVPGAVPSLRKAGHRTCIERGAGAAAGYADDAYRDAGAEIATDRGSVIEAADAIALLHAPAQPESLRRGQVIVGLFDPLGTPETARQLAERGVTAFAFELLPRISRAQPMDALSSMATVAGYESVLVAAATLDKMFPLMMTAAGTMAPAKVLVLGAGVAGLQAIATARRLGAVVEAYDIRPAVKEQVESLGAGFLELPLESADSETSGGYARAMDEEFYRRQRALLGEAVAGSDVVIATAVVPGGTAPVLITAEAVGKMRPGAVIVDLAAESGGNCELTRAGETVDVGGVRIIGPSNLASNAAHHASQMYAGNVTAFLRHVTKDGSLHLDMEDEIIRGCLLAHDGEVVHPRVRELLGIEERSTD